MQSSEYLIMIFTDSEHDAGFGYLGTLFLCVFKDFETLSKCSPSVSNIGCQLFYCFNIVRIDVQPRVSDK